MKKVSDFLEHRDDSVVDEQPESMLPSDSFETTEQFKPITDSNGRVQMVGQRVKNDDDLGPWRAYDSVTVPTMGIRYPSSPVNSFDIIDAVKENEQNQNNNE